MRLFSRIPFSNNGNMKKKAIIMNVVHREIRPWSRFSGIKTRLCGILCAQYNFRWPGYCRVSSNTHIRQQTINIAEKTNILIHSEKCD
jgi:hypothetical protein